MKTQEKLFTVESLLPVRTVKEVLRRRNCKFNVWRGVHIVNKEEKGKKKKGGDVI